MVALLRADEGRDFYADLKLPFGADHDLVKKAYRTLAMEKHPDRNKGREAEVTPEFLVIQSAFDFLNNPESKSRYDLAGRGYHGPSSGVRGNPWQDAGKDYPPPPRRADFMKNSHAKFGPSQSTYPSSFKGSFNGSRRWQQFHTAPTAKASEPDDSRNAYEAFSYMRPQAQATAEARPDSASASASASTSTDGPLHPTPPPPPPPRPDSDPYYIHRTDSARQRTQTSFGNSRRTPYQTNAHTPTDIPSTPNNESARPSADLYGETARRARKSTAASSQGHHNDETSHEPRGPLYGVRETFFRDRRPSEYRSTGGEKYDPFDGMSRSRSMRGSRATPENITDPDTLPDKTSAAMPRSASISDDNHTEFVKSPSKNILHHDGDANRQQQNQASYNVFGPMMGGAKPVEKTINIEDDISPFSTPLPPQSRFPPGEFKGISKDFKGSLRDAPTSNLSENDPMSRPSNLRPLSDSLDGTGLENGKLAAQARPAAYQFNAGGPPSDRLRSRVKRAPDAGLVKSPAATSDEDGSAHRSEGEISERAFDPNEWQQKFGPQTFAPAPMPTTSARRRAPGVRKVNTMKSNTTTNSSDLAVQDCSSSDDESEIDRESENQPGGASPMDIDLPHATAGSATLMNGLPHDSNGARNVPVEPSRADWRTGQADVATAAMAGPAAAAGQQGSSYQGLKATNGPSEDSEDFRATFSDLGKISPLTAQGIGLGSVGDLKAELPFESQASLKVPIERQPAVVAELPFPHIPIAPMSPDQMASNAVTTKAAWEAYLMKFAAYMRDWDDFNGRVVAHFAARADHRNGNGNEFLAARGDSNLVSYLETIQQDRVVRTKWNYAWTEHEKRVGEFVALKQKLFG